MKSLLLIALLATSQAFAQTTTTTTTTADSSANVMKVDEAVKGNDRGNTDLEITNAKLRAQTGSKSKYSIQTALGYSGGSVETPFAKLRPRLSAGSTTETKTVLSGDVSMKYRMNDRNNLNVGTGIGLTTPGHEGQKSEVQNPFISYSNVGKIGEVQSVLSAAVTYFSKSELRTAPVNLDYNISVDHTVIKSVGKSGLDLGLVYAADYSFYQDSNKSGDVVGGATGREDLSLAAFPFLEYAFTDAVSFRTVYRGLTFIHLRGDESNTYQRTDATQSMGIGYAVTRDIYLYPNIQWVWDDIRSEKTNVALSTNINLF